MADSPSDTVSIDFSKLRKTLQGAKTKDELYRAIVNAPFDFRVETAYLFLGIVVLLIANKETGTIDRVALSNTELAKNTTDVSAIPFSDIKIPLDDPENIIARAIATSKPQDTIDWKFLFTPALNAEQARLNQASGGIAYSAVYPFVSDKESGAMIFSYFQYMHNIGEQQHNFMKQYAELVGETMRTQTP